MVVERNRGHRRIQQLRLRKAPVADRCPLQATESLRLDRVLGSLARGQAHSKEGDLTSIKADENRVALIVSRHAVEHGRERFELGLQAPAE
jgi:hypothetical protein